MTAIRLFNKISAKGLAEFDSSKYALSDTAGDYSAVLVRSAALHDETFPKSLMAIARAGAGVNNIPIDRCTDEGIAVFNTPGANANAVKELAICALLLASRRIVEGAAWADSLKGTADIAKQVEKGKSAFAGQELCGKTLGVIGLGAIGARVANAALSLGMKVVGCDPYLSVGAAWSVEPGVVRVSSFEEVYKMSDYITVHVPSTPETKQMICAQSLAMMRDGVRIINLARGDLVNVADMAAALESGKAAAYVTDFPTEETVACEKIITIPHLGASTAEAEDNCAVMAAHELIDYLENGNVTNSVNLPALSMPRRGKYRACVISRANDNIVGDISAKVKVSAIATAERKGVSYTIVDSDGEIDAGAISSADGVIRVSLF